MTDKPNIVFIFSDQHRGDALGCAGNTAVITPQLDRLASQGVVFTNCQTNSPLCMPARVSLITGRHVREHGVWDNSTEAKPADNPSFVRNIRDAGYHTALIGKVHLHDQPAGTHTRDYADVLNDWGFNENAEILGPVGSVRKACPYTDHLANKGLLETHRRFIKTYARSWKDNNGRGRQERPSPLPAEDHVDSYTGHKAVEWIESYNRKEPFFLQIGFPGPHDPFDPPIRYLEMYQNRQLPSAAAGIPREPVPAFVRTMQAVIDISRMGTEDIHKAKALYYGKITLIDETIARIYQALEKRGQLENTWIIYSSDHGEMLGDHGLRQKRVFYRGALNIPCIIHPPKPMDGWQSKALVDHHDLAATMIEVAGAAPLKDCDGQSLVSKIMSGPDGFEAHKGKGVVFSEVVGYTMIMDERYKLTVETESCKPVEMFDLKSDPDELQNRVRDASLADLRAQYLANMKASLASRLNKEKLDAFAARYTGLKQSL